MDKYSKHWHSLHNKDLYKRIKTSQERRTRRNLSRNRKQERITVPAVVHFFKNYDETAKFIDNIKKCVFNDKMNVFLDFSKCEEISTEACVVLAAEIDRCRKKVLNSVTGSYPNDFSVYYLLNELGFFKMLNIRPLAPTSHDTSRVEVVKLQSGKEREKNSARSIVRGIKELFYKESGKESATPYAKNIYEALTEATVNTMEHAYPSAFKEKKSEICVPVWWRAGFKIREENRIFIVIYDQGVGIPNTLYRNWSESPEELVNRWPGGPPDYAKITLAMEEGRSRIKSTGRGKGSSNMLSIIKKNSDGFLGIFSYNGQYTYHSSGELEQNELGHCLEGTLVVWRLSLDKKEIE